MPYLRNCILSVLSSDYHRMEIILCDNASTDGSPQVVEREFPNVKLIRNQSNLSFSRSNNIAFQAAKGSYFFLLNNDATTTAHCVKELIRVAQGDDSIGILGCKIFKMDVRSRLLEHVGGILHSSGYTTNRGYGRIDDGRFEEVRDVDYVTAAAMMVSRRVIERVGPFDSLFSLYYEEVDLCYRARKAGFRVVVVPSAEAYHKGSKTVNRLYGEQSKLREIEKSRVCFVLKNFSLPALADFFLHETRMATSLILRGPSRRPAVSNFLALTYAYLWVIRHLSHVVKSRMIWGTKSRI